MSITRRSVYHIDCKKKSAHFPKLYQYYSEDIYQHLTRYRNNQGRASVDIVQVSSEFLNRSKLELKYAMQS